MIKRLMDIKKRDYSRYYLSINPFPYTPIPEQEPFLYINQEKTITGLLNTISTTYHTGRSSHAVLIGPYGSGKSHALKYIERIIVEQDKNLEKKSLACYISSLGTSFKHIYREFMENIGLALIQKIIKDIDTDDFHYNISQILKALKENGDLHAWRWFLGETLEGRERSRLGISRNIDDILALALFQTVIHLLHKNGFNLICLLIDELETINELYPYQRQAMFNNLRRMIDDNTRGLCSVYACTPAGWDEILGRSLAFSRRLSRNQFYLSRLSEKETIQVIGEYHRFFRILPEIYEVTIDEVYPFTLEACRELYQFSGGNIGELVKYCNLAIDRAIDCGLKEIDSPDITNLLAEFRA